jgi:hypothetical protein
MGKIVLLAQFEDKAVLCVLWLDIATTQPQQLDLCIAWHTSSIHSLVRLSDSVTPIEKCFYYPRALSFSLLSST